MKRGSKGAKRSRPLGGKSSGASNRDSGHQVLYETLTGGKREVNQSNRGVGEVGRVIKELSTHRLDPEFWRGPKREDNDLMGKNQTVEAMGGATHLGQKVGERITLTKMINASTTGQRFAAKENSVDFCQGERGTTRGGHACSRKNGSHPKQKSYNRRKWRLKTFDRWGARPGKRDSGEKGATKPWSKAARKGK